MEQLRALEGTWEFAALELDGQAMSPAVLATARLLIDGDRFRSKMPEGTYEGTFNIDVEIDPHGIDIEFVAGPEAGNWNYGIFRLSRDQLELCLDMRGAPRPAAFRTAPGSGHAFETLRRTSAARPDAVTGGRAQSPPTPDAAKENAGFPYTPCATLARLQGEWTATKVVRDGHALPAAMQASGRRTATENVVQISFGGPLMIDALVRVEEGADPIRIDYYNRVGPLKGLIQHGLLQWLGEEACFCMAAPGQPRPTDFRCPRWKRAHAEPMATREEVTPV